MKARAAVAGLVLMTGWVWGQPRPLDGNPGNVFVRGQEVAVTIPAGEGAKWVCVDFEGRQVAEGSGGRAVFGVPQTGYYEVWTLGEDGTRKQRTTFAVVEPLKSPVPDDSPIALDVAASWFFRKEDAAFGLKEAASLTSLAGVKWMRDRLRWAEVEPEKGNFAEETIYDRTAEIFSSQGMKVLQVFHDSPRWAGGRPEFYPEDLRDVYRFMKTASARWKGKVHAWEPWNEGDATHFGGHTGEQMMAYQRAAALGIQAGNPEAVVCQNVFAEPQMTGVLENFIENLEPAAFDTFNFHHYIQAPAIAKSYADMRKADGGRPIWVTESYFHFRQGVKSSDLDLSEEQRKLRARFVTTNLATALNEGPEQFFTFLLPHYVERGILFGMLNADGTPRADYVALAAAGRLLAGAKPLGKLTSVPSGYAFRAKPDGEEKIVVVAWAEDETPLPEEIAGGEGYDFLGRKPAANTLGVNPVYRVLPVDAKLDLIPTKATKPEGERKELSPLVVQAVFPHDRLRLASSSWEVRQKESLSVPLRVYHFGEGRRKVSVDIEADPVLRVSLSGGSFEIDAEGRGEGTLEIGWSGLTVPARPLQVKVTARSEGVPDCVAVFRVSTQMGDVTPSGRWPVAANDAAKWRPGSSAGDLSLSGTGGLEVVADLKAGDRWVYPWLTPGGEERPRKEAEGVAFTLTPREGTAVYHVMLREPGGSLYVGSLGSLTGDGNPRRLVMLFDEFRWAGYSPPDANHRLDAEAIEAISVGGNPEDARFGYRVENLEWVSFGNDGKSGR